MLLKLYWNTAIEVSFSTLLLLSNVLNKHIISNSDYEIASGLGGMHLVTLSVEGGGHLPPTTISPGDMVCVRISDKRRGGSTMECMRGSVYSLAEDNNSIAVAIEARYGDPTFSRLFGKSLRLDRISALADATTYQVCTPLTSTYQYSESFEQLPVNIS